MTVSPGIRSVEVPIVMTGSFLRHIDLDDRQVVYRIGRNQLGDACAAVGQRDLDFLHAVDHVEVGDDVAALVDHDAGAHAVHFVRTVAASERIVVGRSASSGREC